MDGGVTPTRCATDRMDTAFACPVSSSRSVVASRISSRNCSPEPRGARRRRNGSTDTLTSVRYRDPFAFLRHGRVVIAGFIDADALVQPGECFLRLPLPP